MIKKLINSDLDVATTMRSVFQLSYAVEAKLLNATNFPPLQRLLEDYINSKTSFFGFYKNDELAGVIEIHQENHATYINSLVISPKYFKLGIASQLLEFIFDKFKTKQFFVETGLQNEPATQLYTKFGFKEIKQWDTDHGVRKIKFEYTREF